MERTYIGTDTYDEKDKIASYNGRDLVSTEDETGKKCVAIYNNETNEVRPVPPEDQEEIAKLVEEAGVEEARFPRAFSEADSS